MNILALDTSMGVCSAAVLRTGEPAHASFVREAEMARGHAEALMPMVADVLADANIAARDLDTIAATRGPGSFTGVRIAIAAARGLALVSRAALFGTDSLSVMARAALRAGLAPSGPFAIAVDARRGMIYLGSFDAGGARLDGPILIAPETAAAQGHGTFALALGNGAEILAAAMRDRGRALETALPALMPGAMALAELASKSAERVDVLRPLYLRPPDAKPQTAGVERRQ